MTDKEELLKAIEKDDRERMWRLLSLFNMSPRLTADFEQMNKLSIEQLCEYRDALVDLRRIAKMYGKLRDQGFILFKYDRENWNSDFYHFWMNRDTEAIGIAIVSLNAVIYNKNVERLQRERSKVAI